MKRNLEDYIIQNYKKAIDYHEIRVFYQPVIRTSSKQLCSFDALTSARQLNSIPLALAEFTSDSFKVLFYNTAFAETAHNAGMFTRVFTQEMLSQPQPYHMLTRNIINLIDSVTADGEGRMLFTINDQYFEIRARRMAQTDEKTCVLVGITNLTKDTQSEKTGYLDDSVRQIYALYERITHLNHRAFSLIGRRNEKTLPENRQSSDRSSARMPRRGIRFSSGSCRYLVSS